jgi:hypothetical protein
MYMEGTWVGFVTWNFGELLIEVFRDGFGLGENSIPKGDGLVRGDSFLISTEATNE